ncbi:MAG: HPF/RaiA family ribosome-associated protein [Deltaproteobacteria bacterium]|nr:HPF/RaiA family ribosome-associated protein [Deltaproteobacteria bacterium]
MKLPLQVTFRDIPASPAVERIIEKKVDKIDSLYEGVMGCRVVIEAPHRQHQKGNLYSCHIDLSVAGEKIVVDQKGDGDKSHEDVYNAVNDAFRAAERQLKSLLAKRRDAKRANT